MQFATSFHFIYLTLGGSLLGLATFLGAVFYVATRSSRKIAAKIRTLRYFGFIHFSYQTATLIFLLGKWWLRTGDAPLLFPALWYANTLAAQLILGQFAEAFAVKQIRTGWTRVLWCLRYFLVGLAGVGLFKTLDSVIAGWLTKTAAQLSFTEVNRQLFVWLRSPLCFLITQFFLELSAGWIVWLKLPARRVVRLPEASRSLTRRLRDWKIYELKLDPMGYFGVVAVRERLFYSPTAFAKLSAAEWKYTLSREILFSKSAYVWARLGYAVVVNVLLLIPYLVFVQYATFFTSPTWIPVHYALLYVLLLVGQLVLFRAYRRQQIAAIDSQLAREKDFSNLRRTVRQTRVHLKAINTFRTLTPNIFGAPQVRVMRDTEIGSHRRATQFTRWSLGALSLLALTIGSGAARHLGPAHRLHEAIYQNQTDEVAALLKSGVSPNGPDLISGGFTPLLGAVSNANLAMVEQLLAAGARADWFHPLGLSPLLLACEKGNVPIAAALIASGANVNYHGHKGYTPLMLASVHGHLAAVDLLLQRGANIDDVSRHRSTALMLAVQARKPAIAQRLIARGANAFALDSDGDSAMALARRQKDPTLARILENYTRRPSAIYIPRHP